MARMRTSALWSSGGLAAGVVACGASCFGQSCTPQWLSGGIPSIPSGTVFTTVMWDRDGAGPLPAALVAGGSFTLAGSTAVSNLALWDGVAWFDVGGGVSGTLHGVTAVNSLAVMPNGDLVVAGAFDVAGVGGGAVAANCIARFNGSSWSRMQQGTPSLASSVKKLGVRPNGDLIALGGYPFVNDDNTICGPLVRWNDQTSAMWSDLPGVAPDIGYRTFTVLANGDVVAGGVPGSSPGSSAIWRWNEAQGAWTGFGSGINGTDPRRQVFSILEASNGDIVAAGNFLTAGGAPANSIARWNGTAWLPYGSGITYPSQVFRLAVYALAQMPNGDIVAGGEFDTAGGNVGGRIARWDGTNWTRLPQGAGDIVWSLQLTPQNELMVGGAYNFAGGSFANKRLARFADSPIPWAARHPQSLPAVAHDGTVTLSAAAATSIVGVSYQWNRNGVPIADGPGGASGGGGNVSGASGTLASPSNGAPVTLTITNARASDSGAYTATFVNTCGSGSSLSASVVVGAPPCLADFNGDGFPDGFDYDDFVQCFEGGVCPPGKSADFNGDGFPDGFDYDDYVSAFEAGC